MKDDFIVNFVKYNKTTKKKELAMKGHGSWLGELIIEDKMF